MLERDCQVGIGQKQGSRVKDCAACENAPVYMLVRFCPTVERATAVINGLQPPPLPKRYICLLSGLLLWEPAIWAQAQQTSCCCWMITLRICELRKDFSKSSFLVFINQSMGIFSLNDSKATFISLNIWFFTSSILDGWLGGLGEGGRHFGKW